MIRQNETACWVPAVGNTDHECGEGVPHLASQGEAHLHVARCDGCPVEALPREEDAPCWTVHCDECGEEMDPDYGQHWPDRASALQSVLDIGGVIVGDEHYCPECATATGSESRTSTQATS